MRQEEIEAPSQGNVALIDEQADIEQDQQAKVADDVAKRRLFSESNMCAKCLSAIAAVSEASVLTVPGTLTGGRRAQRLVHSVCVGGFIGTLARRAARSGRVR